MVRDYVAGGNYQVGPGGAGWEGSRPLGTPKLRHLHYTADAPKLRRGEHFATFPQRRNFPTKSSTHEAPPPNPTPPHTQARRHLPPVCATAGYGGGQQSGRPWDRTTAIRLAQSCRHKDEC